MRLYTNYLINIGSRNGLTIDSLRLSWEMRDEHQYDGFFGLVVGGKQRIGKSSYCCQAKAEAYGQWEHRTVNGEEVSRCAKPDYESIKKWIVFPPDEFLDAILNIGFSEKVLSILWDDAGFWLFVLDWYDPFVKVVARYVQLAGRQIAVLMLTSPSQQLISSKVLEALPDMYVCKIVKAGQDTPNFRPRLAKVYQRWSYPDGRKGGVKTRWKDKFNVMLPDPFWNWYKPKSDHYLDQGLVLLKKEVAIIKKRLLKKKDLVKNEEIMEAVYEVAGSPERLSEVEEVIKEFESEKDKKPSKA